MNNFIYLSLFFFVVFQHPVSALEDASEPVTECVINNVTYNEGDRINYDNPCKICRCAPNEPDQQVCAEVDCPFWSCPPGLRLVYLPGRCCPICVPVLFCEIDNVTYRIGENVPNTNPCKTCVCDPREPDQQRCHFIYCDIPLCGPCGLKYYPDECCPGCMPECVIDDVIYCEGDPVDTDNPCERCICDPEEPDQLRCDFIYCDEPQCGPCGLKYYPDECCPGCKPECVINNVTYCEGDFINYDNPCKICQCAPEQPDQQVCAEVNCPFWSCPPGLKLVYLPDRCCPICVPVYPECTFQFCKKKKNALCAKTDAVGDCTDKVTACEAAYYSKDERPAPAQCSESNSCAGLTGEKLEKCLKNWRKCVKKAFKDQYGKTSPKLRKKQFFKTLEYPCGG